ncbi:MAG: hypothetical protein D6725_05065, partial [Planctomycetota bacterium]
DTICSVAREAGLTLTEFAQRIGRSQQTLEELTAELSIGETYFFREPAHFEILRKHVFDQWARDCSQPLTIWSAACASGEEPYSAAIVAHEAGLGDRVRIIGTDISHRALTKAREAVYRPWSLRGLAADRARPYLAPQPDGRWKVKRRIREMVTFDRLNLANDPYPAVSRGLVDVQVIFCRNVLIYFDPDVIAAVARKLYDTLAPGGWLFLGASDPSLARHAPFELVMTDGGIAYRKSTARRIDVRPGRTQGVTEPRASALPVASERAPQGSSPRCAPSGDSAGSASGQAAGLGADDRRPSGAGKECGDVAVRPDKGTGVGGEVVESLRKALQEGDYEHVLRATEGMVGGEVAALRVRALAGLDPAAARTLCERLLSADPLNVPLRYVQALVLLDLGESTLALQALHRVLFLSRDEVEALFTLATIQDRLGNREEAAKALRTAESLCARRDPDERLPLGDGATVREMIAAIQRHPAYPASGFS